jgi:hypothetical protein
LKKLYSGSARKPGPHSFDCSGYPLGAESIDLNVEHIGDSETVAPEFDLGGYGQEI